MIRVGIVGRGFGQKVHRPAFLQNPHCEVAAVCGGREDWRRLVTDPALDAVSIAVPPFLQFEIALIALKTGKAVLCEKPLALTVSQARQLVRTAAKRRLANMIDFEFPEIPAWIQLKKMFVGGAIGSLRHASVLWNVETYANAHDLDSWKTQKKGGGALALFGSHTLYYLEWLLGPIARLSANLRRFKNAPGSADTQANLNLEFKSGLPATVNLSTHAFLGNGHRLEFFGDKGTLVLENTTADYVKGFRLLLGTRKTKKFKMVPVSWPALSSAADGRIAALRPIVDRFVKWIRTGKPQTPSFKEGLRVQHLMGQVLLSNKMGRWVK